MELKVVPISARVHTPKPKFKEGQEVVLRGSAADVMTVEASDAAHTTCIWHDSAGVIQRESFKNATLRRLSTRERVEMK